MKFTPMMTLVTLGTLVLCSLLGGPSAGQSGAESAEAQYFTAVADDPVARLQKKIDSGEVRLEHYGRHGYLRAVLRELGISPASQTLVFSRTSLQRDHISPNTPRALYFNDNCYVGWVQGENGVIEIAAVDPRQGQIFYTLRQDKVARPRFVRKTDDCLQCHGSTMTGNVPGLVIRSVFARPDGDPDLGAGTFLTTPESPLDQRWGGWYVSGRHGSQRHMGNVVARGGEGQATLDREAGANVTDLSRFFDTGPYLSGHSDIVALMVLEHQALAHNLITKTSYLVRDALRDERVMNAAEGKKPDERRASTQSRIKSAGEPLVRALLFAGEAPLTEPVAGTSAFAKEFAGGGPRDKAGRSLRDLDLQTRLFRYPCSFLIYSEAFDALPGPAKEYVFARLAEILGGKEQSKEQSREFAHLSPADRQAILEILRETKPDFAAFLQRTS